MNILSGDAMFTIYNNTVREVYDMNLFSGGNEITSIRVPYEVQWHKDHLVYAHMKKLKELIADPNSPVYETIDGALCRRSGSIEYVPQGKSSLHIDKKIKAFGYKTLETCNNLDAITVDPDSEYFTVYNNCLFNKAMTRLMFVPRSIKTLIIPETLETIDSYVFCHMKPEKIEIVGENSRYSIKDGILYQENDLIYMPSYIRELHVGKEVRQIRCSLKQICSITADTLNPWYTVIDNTLFDKTGSKLIFCAGNEKTITVFLHTEVEKDFLKCFDAEECMINVIVNDDFRLSFGGNTKDLRRYQSIIRKHMCDIKPGTEYLFLEMYLKRWNIDEMFKRNFKFSTAQILYRIIEDNNLEIMKKVLEDGTIMTRKHFKRSLKHSADERRTDMYQLLYGYDVKEEFIK